MVSCGKGCAEGSLCWSSMGAAPTHPWAQSRRQWELQLRFQVPHSCPQGRETHDSINAASGEFLEPPKAEGLYGSSSQPVASLSVQQCHQPGTLPRAAGSLCTMCTLPVVQDPACPPGFNQFVRILEVSGGTLFLQQPPAYNCFAVCASLLELLLVVQLSSRAVDANPSRYRPGLQAECRVRRGQRGRAAAKQDRGGHGCEAAASGPAQRPFTPRWEGLRLVCPEEGAQPLEKQAPAA